ncbi:MAG: CpsD/CapB family tyrosine-protein kinase [Candidatus Rokubacteria bacterium]|nr:CpsD/CapB family tyrosine-protein kinase [Candidatus Rokubacteria bacterium]
MAERGKRAEPRGQLLITETDPKSPASEAYRTLRTNIQFAGLDVPHRSIVVTSSSAGEGKTTTVANFGVVAAQAGSRVCVVDADLRRPALHRIFNLSNARGLTTALVEGLPFAKIAQPTRVPNLSTLTSGPLPPNPAELVGSKRMRELIEGSADDFDLVLFDTPPVISVSDPVALAAQCDGVILVIMSAKIPHNVVRRAAEQIEAVKGRILGVLLNSVNLQRDGYYYDYYRYYHAYYGGDKKR